MKIGMLFPGYGSQFVGMGKELYDESRIMQEYFEEASNCLNMNFVKLCFASSDSELSKMSNAYPALFLVSSSICAILKSAGVEPTLVAGYNSGEYAAMHAAGGLSLPDGLYLLNKYATFFQDFLATTSVAAARVSGIDAKELERLCKEMSEQDSCVYVAIYESAREFYIAGHAQAVLKVRTALQEKKVSTKDANIEIGLHAPMMEQVASQFKMYLEKVDFKDMSVPLLSAINAEELQRSHELKEYVVNHIHEPIRWDLLMKRLHDYDLLIEIGPGKTLSTMMLKHYPETHIVTINRQSDIDELVRSLNGSQTTESGE